ncbi:unnamed protein product [Calicophoron daubneyi]|uniref:Uncharacterized protein n=1 Tax=Calicophoron daubneyi TaxID=300641 RepID=A0AAV2T1T9_CALDB
MVRMLIPLLACILWCLAVTKAEDLPPLIDSLVIPFRNDPIPSVIRPKISGDQRIQTPFQRHESTRPPLRRRLRKKKRRGKPLSRSTKQSELSERLPFPSEEKLHEAHCPQVCCFTTRAEYGEEVVLNCGKKCPERWQIIDHLDCLYWKNPTAHLDVVDTELAFSGPSGNSGRGYDLKLILAPAPLEAVSGKNKTEPERRIKVDRLTDGVLEWLIHSVRESLQMQLSPIHLTLSFMYIGKLRRVDLGNLSSRLYVTRLSIWNPFEWEEDSFIAPPVAIGFGTSTTLPYFRLTVFCDHANQKAGFRRLWFPWKSWQVRFNQCYDSYVCRSWISRYAICDRLDSSSASPRMFTPSSFLIPKPLSSDSTALSKGFYLDHKGSAPNQIVYENQCQSEPDLLDPVDDLKLDHQNECWQVGGFSDRMIPAIQTTVRLQVTQAPDVVPTSAPTTVKTHESSAGAPAAARISTTTAGTTSTTTTLTTSTQTTALAANKTVYFYGQTTTSEETVYVPANIPMHNTSYVSEKAPENELTSTTTVLSTHKAEVHVIPTEKYDETNLKQTTQGTTGRTRGETTTHSLILAVIVLAILVIILLFTLVVLMLYMRRWKSRYQMKDKDFATPYCIRVSKIPDTGYTALLGSKNHIKHYESGVIAGPEESHLAPYNSFSSLEGRHKRQLPPPYPVHVNNGKYPGHARTPSMTPSTDVETDIDGSCPATPRQQCSKGAPRERKFRTPETPWTQLRSSRNLYGSRSSVGSHPPTRRRAASASSSRDMDSTSTPNLSPRAPSRLPRKQMHQAAFNRAYASPLMRRKNSPTKMRRKVPHTFVFEDGQLSEDRLPEGLRLSFSKIMGQQN